MQAYLPSIWFLLWGLLWAIYFALDGFDLGAGMLAAWLPKRERETAVRSLGPVWDGNEVWLITAGGVTFAAFPKLYATMFSSLYAPLMLVLVALILRAVAIEFSHLVESEVWKGFWINVLSVASLLVALLLGVAFGNIFQGLPFDQAGYHGTLLTLLNPYGLLTGVLFVVAFLYNGSAWLARAEDRALRERGMRLSAGLWPVFLALAALFMGATPFATELFANYLRQPLLLLLPLLAVAALVGARLFMARRQAGLTLIAGSGAVLLTVMAAVVGLYPNMFPSSLDPAMTLTAFNAASSLGTLRLMLIVTIIFLPIVLLYQIWFYKLFNGPETDEEALY